jgi:hypothetical protein
MKEEEEGLAMMKKRVFFYRRIVFIKETVLQWFLFIKETVSWESSFFLVTILGIKFVLHSNLLKDLIFIKRLNFF